MALLQANAALTRDIPGRIVWLNNREVDIIVLLMTRLKLDHSNEN